MNQLALFPDTDIVGTGRPLGDWPIQRPGIADGEPATIQPLPQADALFDDVEGRP